MTTLEDSDSFETSLFERQNNSRLFSALVLTVVFGCSTLTVVGSLHPVFVGGVGGGSGGDVLDQLFVEPRQFALLCGAALLVHPLTVYVFATTGLWLIDNKVRLLLGCTLAAACTAGLGFAPYVVEQEGGRLWAVATLRVAQEAGFALASYALPALLCTEMASSANVLIPLYVAGRGAAAFLAPSLVGWMTQLSPGVPFGVVAGGLVAAAILSCCLFDAKWDTYRRSARRAPTLDVVSWDVAIVALLTFTSFFSIVFVVVVLPAIVATSTPAAQILTATSTSTATIGSGIGSLVLNIGVGLYLAATPLVGMFIRWLPPRGVLYTFSLIASLLAFALLEAFLSIGYVVTLFGAVIALSLGLGVLPVLTHMHLLDRTLPRIYSRHHVAAARLVSVAGSMGALSASAAPALVKQLGASVEALVVGLLLPVGVCVMALLAVLATIAVEVFRPPRGEEAARL